MIFLIKVYTVAAFTSDKNGGNLAGVVPNAEGLSEDQMQAIAKRMNYSETAFITRGNKGNHIDGAQTNHSEGFSEISDSSDSADFADFADFNVRFFTPSSEVDLCGHATIASFKLLRLKGYIEKGTYTQKTLAGILEVTVTEDDLILMQQTKPKFLSVIDDADIAKSLGISEGDIDKSLPVQIVSTGLNDIIIPVRSLDILKNINPDFDLISSLSKKYDSIGYHVFCTEALTDADAACRNFAPLYDIDEESATGTANGALCSYMFRYDVLRDNDYSKVTFEQGHFMDSPSQIVASLKIANDEIEEVLIGGNAVIISEQDIEI